MPFNIRKPFARRQTDLAVIQEAGSGMNAGAHHGMDEKGALTLDESAISSSVDQLKKFKKTHKWDYNLDYDTIVCLCLIRIAYTL